MRREGRATDLVLGRFHRLGARVRGGALDLAKEAASNHGKTMGVSVKNLGCSEILGGHFIHVMTF